MFNKVFGFKNIQLIISGFNRVNKLLFVFICNGLVNYKTLNLQSIKKYKLLSELINFLE